jgi:hypothetical protein
MPHTDMDLRLPFLIRFHLGVHRLAVQFEKVTREFLNAVAWSWTPPSRRDAVTCAVYARLRTYLRGGEVFQRGLLSWERDAFARPEWPNRGRILVGGAGGGRELLALAAQGHVVRAFEPVPLFAAACAKECLLVKEASCVEGSYADLVEAVHTRAGPLAALASGPPFDAVVLGWASLSHVTEPALVGAVLEATRRLSPHGPVFTSFYLKETSDAPGGRTRRLGQVLDRIFAALGAPGRRPDSGAFHPTGGFLMTYTAEEFTSLAGRHGYRVAAITSIGPQPWALLVPASDSSGG